MDQFSDASFSRGIVPGIWDQHYVVQAFARHRIAALASAPVQLDPTPLEATADRMKGGDPVNDMALLLMRVWAKADPRSTVAQAPASYIATFADMARAALAHPRPAVDREAVAGAEYLTPASGLDDDGVCNEHGRYRCKACVTELLAPLAKAAAAMPHRDGVARIIAEAGRLNERGHADWSVHADVFADMVIALATPPASLPGESTGGAA